MRAPRNPKAQLYLDALAMLNTNRVELLDVPRIEVSSLSLKDTQAALSATAWTTRRARRTMSPTRSPA